MSTLIIFLIILGLLVLSHEFGHFVAARKSGMKVYEFGFGFPPRFCGLQVLIKKDNGDRNPTRKYRIVWGRKPAEELPNVPGYESGTIYSFNWLPLGGFVRIKGEEGQEDGPDSFMAKPYYKKAIVLVAGVAMNIMLAAVIFSIGFMWGLPQALDGSEDPAIVSSRQLQIMQVLPDRPAQIAGFKAGDIIIKIDNLETPKLEQMQTYVDLNKDQEIMVTVKRGDEIIAKKITPTVYQDTGKGGIGVGLSEVGIIKYPWYKAIYKGFILSALYLKMILWAFGGIIKGLFIGSSSATEALSGPIGIAVLTGQIAKLGIPYLLNFTAVLSLNLAILNILPIPALDGGRLLFITIGRIFKRQVPLKFEQMAHSLGFLLLMLAVIIITFKDIGRFTNIWQKFF